MPQQSFAARYRAAERLAGGRCPDRSRTHLRLADHECRHRSNWQLDAYALGEASQEAHLATKDRCR
jgi:hypothetical protein